MIPKPYGECHNNQSDKTLSLRQPTHEKAIHTAVGGAMVGEDAEVAVFGDAFIHITNFVRANRDFTSVRVAL